MRLFKPGEGKFKWDEKQAIFFWKDLKALE